MPPYPRRTFTPRGFARQLTTVVDALPALVKAYLRPVVAPALREKVMLGTTSVNDCRYCAWVHGAMAQHHGVDLEELRRQLADAGVLCTDDREAAAIRYAQSYAETGGDPDPAITAALFSACGEPMARELVVYVKSIHFANLSGNTFDAFLSRLAGRPAEGGSLAFELLFACAVAPILLPVLPLVRRAARTG